jgi:hypothetical protein
MGKTTNKKVKNALEDKDKKKRKKATAKNLKSSESQPKEDTPAAIGPDQRYKMIATAAYYIAEKHGFDPRRSAEDWALAEEEIDTRLRSQKESV